MPLPPRTRSVAVFSLEFVVASPSECKSETSRDPPLLPISEQHVHAASRVKESNPEPATRSRMPSAGRLALQVNPTSIRESERPDVQRQNEGKLRDRNAKLRVAVKRRITGVPLPFFSTEGFRAAQKRGVEKGKVAPQFLAAAAKRQHRLLRNRYREKRGGPTINGFVGNPDIPHSRVSASQYVDHEARFQSIRDVTTIQMHFESQSRLAELSKSVRPLLRDEAIAQTVGGGVANDR